jgi:hypothetical protein
MKVGTLVVPRPTGGSIKALYLTPRSIEDADNIENWIEWDLGQIGIIMNVSNSGLMIMTKNGIGYCFEDELIEVITYETW